MVPLPKGPNYSSHVLPRSEGSPTASALAAGAALVTGCVCGQRVVAVGTMAGMWEMGRGISTAQDGCAALPPLSPVGTTTLVTPLDSTGGVIAQ